MTPGRGTLDSRTGPREYHSLGRAVLTLQSVLGPGRPVGYVPLLMLLVLLLVVHPHVPLPSPDAITAINHYVGDLPAHKR